MMRAFRTSAWLFSLNLLAGCAASRPVRTELQPVPPDAGPICVNSRTDPKGAAECGRRLDAYVRRNIAAAVKLTPILYSAEGGAAGAEGTGAVVSEDGLIVTAYHVIKDADYILATDRRVNIGFGLEVVPRRTVPLVVVRTDPEHDLALLRPKHPEKFEAVLAPDQDREPLVGDLLWQFGQKTIGTRGQVKELARRVVTDNPRFDLGLLVSMEAEGHEGDSGGPVVSLEGRLVGIVLAMNESQGRVHFQPIGPVLKLLAAQAAADAAAPADR